MIYKSVYVLTLTALFVIATSCVNAVADERIDLFTRGKNRGAIQLKGSPTINASSIRINHQAQFLEVGDTLRVPISDQASAVFQVYRRVKAANGDVSLWAKGGTPQDWLVVTFGDQQTYAGFGLAGQNYTIGWDRALGSFLIDGRALPKGSIELHNDMFYPSVHGKAPLLPKDQPPVTNQSSAEKSIISLMAVYSPAFSSAFGSAQTRINQMINFTNAAYERSGIKIELEFVHSLEIDFYDYQSPHQTLFEVTEGSGDFTTVSFNRAINYVDLVTVLPFVDRPQVRGAAWVSGRNMHYAHSVVQFARWGSDAVFAHELGHNLGSGHERATVNPQLSNPCDPSYTFAVYACGHGNGAQGTLMSYLDRDGWGNVFSNPRQTCSGIPCGVRAGLPDAADNHRAFNESGPLVARYDFDPARDVDFDGIYNEYDNCPEVANPLQTNTDGDARGNACDSDDDNDGVLDRADNCRLIRNPDQADSNGDGVGDVCDTTELCFPIVAPTRQAMFVCL
jgi:hypothetical protein